MDAANARAEITVGVPSSVGGCALALTAVRDTSAWLIMTIAMVFVYMFRRR